VSDDPTEHAQRGPTYAGQPHPAVMALPAPDRGAYSARGTGGSSGTPPKSPTDFERAGLLVNLPGHRAARRHRRVQVRIYLRDGSVSADQVATGKPFHVDTLSATPHFTYGEKAARPMRG